MKTTKNTILITGGTSGIGLELAKQFVELGNTVIVTGRDQKKLDETKKKLPKVETISSDAGDPKSIVSLFNKTTKEFPELNIVINNAGIMKRVNFHDKGIPLSELTKEIEINLMGPLWITKQFLPHLKSKKEAAIVNVSSGLAFVPLPISPVYCATKAALHSFSQSLRIQLKDTSVKVFELAPPATETPLLRGDFASDDLKGVKAMDVQTLAKQAIVGIEKDVFEIRPGMSNALKLMSRVAPQFILNQMGKSAENMAKEVEN